MKKSWLKLAEMTVIPVFFVFSLLCTGCALLCSGCSPRILPPAQRDTVTIIRHDTIIRMRTDTVQIHMPHDSVIIITGDTVSRLSIGYALSEASVSAGLLSHRLWSNPDWSLEVPVTVTDTVIRSDTVFKAAATEYIEVPASLTRWQRITQVLGNIFIGLLGAVLLYALYRIFVKK